MTGARVDARRKALPALIARLDYGGAAAEERVRALRGTGVNAVLVGWPNGTPYCFGWDGRQRYDYRPMDAQLDALLEIDSGLHFLLGFGSLHGAPYYWGVDHQEELGRFHCGLPMQAPSLGSTVWLRDSSEAAHRFAVHVGAGRHAERVIGFVPFSIGVDWHGVGESFVEIPDKETPQAVPFPKEGDFSTPMLTAYRAFLREKYGSDAALQAAWQETGVTLGSARLPSRADVRSPLPHVADYFECYNRLNARQAIAWCAALKKGAPDSVVGLTHGLVYGYPNRDAIHPQGSGHNAPEELLACPAIDFLMSTGGPLSEHAIDSIKLAGKMHVHVFEGANLQLVAEADQAAGLAQAAGYAAVKGSRLALGELRYGPLSPGGAHEQYAILPYDSDGLRQAIARLPESPPAPSLADVATFISPRGSYRRALEKGFGERIERFRNQVLLRSGLCYDEYLLSDFDKVADRYRFWVFIDCPELPAAAWKDPQRSCVAVGSAPVTQPAELRQRATIAGAHLWCATDDAVFASSRQLLFVAHSAGEKTVVLPSGKSLTFAARQGETRLVSL